MLQILEMHKIIWWNMENRKDVIPVWVPTPVTFVNLLRIAPWIMSWSIVTAIGSAALSIAPFWFIYLIAVELFDPMPDMTKIWRLALIALALFLLRWLLMVASHILAHIGAFSLIYRLRLALAHHLGRVPLSFFSGRGSGALQRTIHDDVGGLEGFYAHMLPDTVSAAAVPLFTLILLFFADWRLGIAVLLPLPLAIFAQWWWMSRTMGKRMVEWERLQKSIANQVGEYVRAITVIKSFGLDARSFGDLAQAVRGAAAWVEDYAKTSTGGFVIFSGLLRGTIVLVAPLGAILYMQASLDLPTYILFLLISPLVLEPLLRLMFALHELFHKAQAMERINGVLQAKILTQNTRLQSPEEPLDIEFIDVSHHYDERLSLENVTCLVKAGQMTAIVGPSGSGKTTLLRLIVRLYDFDQGQLHVGGLDIRDWPLDALLTRISIVFQEVFLFSGTVRDNLKLARAGATDEEIEAAAKIACAHDFISALPRGYETQLGENGARLSGGERQRLSIARAVLKDAPILLLDEATASLDAENEQMIRQALRALCHNRTVLMICHHLHTAMTADHILVMQEGRLVSQGRHADLLHDCPTYQRLWHDHEHSRHWHFERYSERM